MNARFIETLFRHSLRTLTCITYTCLLLSFARGDSVTWDPSQKPAREADTLFLPDLTSLDTITKDGGFLFGHANETSAMVLKNFDFGPGKFGPAVRGKPVGYTFVQYPIDGLLSTDEFTVEFWAKWDAAPTAVSSFFALSGNNSVTLSLIGGQLDLTVQVPVLKVRGSLKKAAADLQLEDSTWHEFALTFKDATLHLWVDGREAGNLPNIRFLPTFSDGTHGTGVLLGGDAHASSGAWISDVRFSRTARTPGQAVTLRPLDGTVTVDAGTQTGTISPTFVGALHPGGSPPQSEAAFEIVRTDKMINSTPIVRGPPDATHPTAGKSGAFSYDWEVVDRTMDWFKSRHIAAYISLDSTPQILGGGSAPYQGDKLKTAFSKSAGYNEQVPNSESDWGTIISDLANHILKERGDQVAYWSFWNEPAAMFKGPRETYYEMYGVTVNAVRAVDPQAKVGGPEDASLSDWTYGLIAYAKDHSLPLDFASYHNYSGDLSELDVSRIRIDAAAKDRGYTTPLPVVLGEYQWSAETLYKSGLARWATGMWTLRSLDAAYLTASLIRVQQLGGFPTLIVAHAEYGTATTGGWASMQLIGPNGEQWAPYNALKGWKQVMGPDILASQQDLPPGVYALATKDAKTGRVGIALANWGFANRNARTVHLALGNLPAGNWTVKRYLIDAEHSSRWDASVATPPADPSAHDDLELVATTPIKATGSPVQMDVVLPYWSSTYLSIEPQP